ncbi:protein FAM13A isoform X1 [Synchiropus splendidus]|uniref:protein FAM13A isoform X1 n=1 Tax=Synchiropus splendidus TaxID=270530 RepID=UPI00237D3FEB|nr:protein FAM13A isoform X1 [Synchiropus splendidus]
MGAGALTICHNETAILIKEDMKKMVHLPILRPRPAAAKYTQLFGVPLCELQEKCQVEDGVPLVVRRMVEHLRSHALHHEGLFRVSGNVRAVENLKQHLESGDDVDFSHSEPCTISSLLKKFLRDLPGGVVDSAVQKVLIQHYKDSGDEQSWSELKELLLQLPSVNLNLLRYLCQFLTVVALHQEDNRMTALNLATVLGPSVFHVSPGFEALMEQNICNKIMVMLIQNYSSIFEDNAEKSAVAEPQSTLIVVKEAQLTDTPRSKTPTPVPRVQTNLADVEESLCEPCSVHSIKRHKKVRKGRSDARRRIITRPICSVEVPRVRPRSMPEDLPVRGCSPEVMEKLTERLAQEVTVSGPTHLCVSSSDDTKALQSGKNEDRPISPYYMSSHLSAINCRPDVVNILDRTIRSTVEELLFEVDHSRDPVSDDCDLTSCQPSLRVTQTARQRRRHCRERQEEGIQKERDSRVACAEEDTNKENIPASGEGSTACVGENRRSKVEPRGGLNLHKERSARARKSSPMLVLKTDRKDTQTEFSSVPGMYEQTGVEHTETLRKGSDSLRPGVSHLSSQTLRMKIQESPVSCDTGRIGGGEIRGSDPDCDCEDIPRLDLTALTEDNNWGEPVPANSPLQRESMDRDEARLSPHAGGRLIRQLLEEDSDPMLSPRFYAYGQCQQYLDDTEVPPSPPNAHSFVSRRRSSSLGSCDDEKEELTTAQLTKRIHVLKKKIHRFEEKFEEERKYRPSHSDKAGNPEVLRWVNELAKLRKMLKEHKIIKSEEDLPPQTRQRSNTLPKSFGSQLEKKPQQEKVPKPPVENTLEAILKKLQEKREEVNRPEDIKDMTREQISAEKVALQKSLLYYESIHGRPVTKSERQVMKPLYDRYRLVKQILCRASTIPVIGSPSSKRRGLHLQPIIEGETALFFEDIKEEEDGSEDDGDSKSQFSVTARPDFSVLGLLEHMEEEVDGFISPVDQLSPSKTSMDMRLSNLHSADMQELVEQLQEAREEKKRIRKSLKEFEEEFFRQNGRNAQKEDRSPLAVEYSEYKHVKAKLRLLEVLISKRDSSKFI